MPPRVLCPECGKSNNDSGPRCVYCGAALWVHVVAVAGEVTEIELQRLGDWRRQATAVTKGCLEDLNKASARLRRLKLRIAIAIARLRFRSIADSTLGRVGCLLSKASPG